LPIDKGFHILVSGYDHGTAVFLFIERKGIRMGKELQPTNNRVRVGIIIASLIFGVAWAVIMILIGKD
jgi:hypothetical protein